MISQFSTLHLIFYHINWICQIALFLLFISSNEEWTDTDRSFRILQSVSLSIGFFSIFPCKDLHNYFELSQEFNAFFLFYSVFLEKVVEIIIIMFMAFILTINNRCLNYYANDNQSVKQKPEEKLVFYELSEWIYFNICCKNLNFVLSFNVILSMD